MDFWLREMDSNHQLQLQRLICYPYTIPRYLSHKRPELPAGRRRAFVLHYFYVGVLVFTVFPVGAILTAPTIQLGELFQIITHAIIVLFI